MRKLLFPLIILSLTLTSCGSSDIQQGEIQYEITYPYSDLSGIMDVMLPKNMTVKFKGDRMIASIEKGKIFRTDILSNNKTKEFQMRLDFGSQKIEADLSADDLDSLLASQPDYQAVLNDQMDTVAGLPAKFYTVMSEDEAIGEFKCAFSTNLSIQNTEWFNSYSGTKGLPLIYIIERYGIVMHLRAVKFRSREIADEEFETGKKKLKSVSYREYEKTVTELFQLIIEE